MDARVSFENERLTPREVEVLYLLANGCTYAQVGERLGVSVHTVTSHIKNSYRKLDVHSAAAAVMRAVQLGFLARVETLVAAYGAEQ